MIALVGNGIGGDNEILTKMLGSMNITTNTETITFLQRIVCICKDLPG